MEKWFDYRELYKDIPRPLKRSKIRKNSELLICEEEKERIYSLLNNFKLSPYIESESEEFIKFSEKNIYNCLDYKTINRIVREVNINSGFILIKNLPFDAVGNTPKKIGALESDMKKTFITEFLSIGLGNILGGDLFSYRQEGWGSSPIIDNIVPMENLKKQKGAGGYDNNFPFHVESGWHNKRVDYLILHGIKGDKDAKTLLFSSSDLKGTHFKESLLTKPMFQLKAPQVYLQMEEEGMEMGTAHTKICRPIEFENDEIKLNLNFNGMDCIDLECAESLYELETFIEDNALEYSLGKGECLLMNNYKICHTRTDFSPIYDGNQRWIQRSYFKKNLWEKPYSFNEVASLDLFINARENGWITDNLEVTSLFFERQKKHNNIFCNFLYQFLPSKGDRII